MRLQRLRELYFAIKNFIFNKMEVYTLLMYIHIIYILYIYLIRLIHKIPIFIKRIFKKLKNLMRRKPNLVYLYFILFQFSSGFVELFNSTLLFFKTDW